jgi:hypothetical protein
MIYKCFHAHKWWCDTCPLSHGRGDGDLRLTSDLQHGSSSPWGLRRGNDLWCNLPSPWGISASLDSASAQLGSELRHATGWSLQNVRMYITANDEKWRFMKIHPRGWCSRVGVLRGLRPSSPTMCGWIIFCPFLLGADRKRYIMAKKVVKLEHPVGWFNGSHVPLNHKPYEWPDEISRMFDEITKMTESL